jgi:NADP-dependent 3-hydroxy acid dehydrogenase YdfG
MLAAAGAEHLLLTSRRGSAAEGASELAKELRELGAEVTIAAVDVVDRDALSRLLTSIPQDRPLTTVVHAAGAAQRPAPLSELTLEECEEVGRAKVIGALNLDSLLGDLPLDAFVLFSSGAAVWGSVGQTAYAGANAVLDALAQRRRAQGRTAVSIAWGSWDAGMVGADLATFLRRLGAPPMSPVRARAALRQVLEHDSDNVVVADFDWSRFAPAYALARPRPLLDTLPEVREILAAGGGTGDEPMAGPALTARLAGMSVEDQGQVLLDLVRSHVAVLLGYDEPAAVPATRTFNDLGFDSVGAVDLRNRLMAATGRHLSASMIFDYVTPMALAGYLRSVLCPEPVADQSATMLLERLEAAVAALSAAEIERTRFSSRLQTVLTRLDDIRGVSSEKDIVETLREGDAEDVFDFIDREFGVA